MLLPTKPIASLETLFSDPSLQTSPYVLRRIDDLTNNPHCSTNAAQDAKAHVAMEADRLTAILTFGSEHGPGRLAEGDYDIGDSTYSVERGAYDRPWLIVPVEIGVRAIFSRFDELHANRQYDDGLRNARLAEHMQLIVDVHCQWVQS